MPDNVIPQRFARRFATDPSRRLFALSSVALLALAACKEPQRPPRPAPVVSTMTATKGPLPFIVSANGQIEPNRTVAVQSLVSGMLTRVAIAEGDEVAALGWRSALTVGLCQCFALIPGTSRSLATILGGRVAGLSHAAATEFSFLVGLLTLSAASVYKAWSLGPALPQVYPAGPALVGLLIAAVTAFLSVRWLVGFVSRRGLGVFAWYRIALGGAILAVLAVRTLR